MFDLTAGRARSVQIATLLAATLCLAAPAGDRTAEAAPVAHAAASRSDNERAIRQCVNRERRKRDLAPLELDRDLARAARLHATNMRKHRFFDHTDQLGRGPSERVALFTDRFSGAGENIYGGPQRAAAVCAGWMRSSGHRANFLNPSYRFVGTGYAAGGPYRHYWVQVFAGKPVKKG